MSRLSIGVITVLAVLLAVQTIRVGTIKREYIRAVGYEGPAKANDASRTLAVGDPVLRHKDAAPVRGYPAPLDVPDAQAPEKDVFLLDENGELIGELADALKELSETPAPTEADTKKEAERKRQAERQAAMARSHERYQDAMKALQHGMYDNAIPLLRASIKENPWNGNAYRQLGNIFRSLGRTDEELALYDEWAAQSEKDGTPHYLRAQALKEMGMYEEAQESLAEFEARSRGETYRYPMLSEMYHDLGMEAERGELLEEWVRTVPNSAWANQQLAEYYRQTGQFELSLAQYQYVSDQVPLNAHYRQGVAGALMGMGRYEEADEELEIAMALKPNDPRIIQHRGWVRLNLGDFQGARELFLEAGTHPTYSDEADRGLRAVDWAERNARNQQQE